MQTFVHEIVDTRFVVCFIAFSGLQNSNLYVVCYTAVFSGEERCVTTLKTAV